MLGLRHPESCMPFIFNYQLSIFLELVSTQEGFYIGSLSENTVIISFTDNKQGNKSSSFPQQFLRQFVKCVFLCASG